MPSRTISVEQGAYDLLAKAKLPGESFSQTVRRLVAPKVSPLRQMIGAWSPEQAEEIRAAVDENREYQRARSEQKWRERGWL